MDSLSYPNLVAMFLDQAARRGERPFLWHKADGAWVPTSWAETRRQVVALARGLRSLGLQRGDRVGLVAENRPEWVIADLAVLAAGGISVPAYTTNTPDDHRHILANSGARFVIVSTAALAQRLLPAVEQVPSVIGLVAIEPPSPGQLSHADLHLWSDVMARGAGPEDEVVRWSADIGRDDIACLIHTSGTGGVPKGVITTHGNILANCHGAIRLLQTIGLGDEVFLSFLPLSHSYEHTGGMMFPIAIGAQIYFAEKVEALASNMLEVRPTIMTAVPRLYETMHQRILRNIEREGGRRAKMLFAALRVGRKRIDEPDSMTLVERLTDVVLDRIVRSKVKARFGGRLKALVSGGAPLNPEIGMFFLALGVPLLQGYGQTEASPVVSANPPNRIKIRTVGPPMDGVDVRIAEDGEILVRGPSVMKGYWNDPEATQRTIENGWLHTGDIGEKDPDGYLVITDRKRDFIKNSGGDMISPARVEGQLVLQPEIGQAMVYGDNRPYLVALVVPRPEFLETFAREHRRASDGKDGKDGALQKAIQGAVEHANESLPVCERVRRFMIAEEPFSIQNGMMTPTLKIKRHAIRQAYGDKLAGLYDART
ncbi:MAG TPA: long-chain fatty acid--CoA ligase [Stellaceae bacterium]|nr:long-chain fatty acid--CoA ligase [Stellaceae bacterium]